MFKMFFGAFLNPSDDANYVSDDSFKILSLLATMLTFVSSVIRFCELIFEAECFLTGFSLLPEIWGSLESFYDSRLRFMWDGVENAWGMFVVELIYFFAFFTVPFS